MKRRCTNCKYVYGIGCSNPTGPCSYAVDGYPKWKPKETSEKQPAIKTLLDEFAMAAMAAIISKTPLGMHEYYEVNELNSQYNMTAGGAYSYAAAMMAERARRDEMGNVKEVTE